MKTCNDANQLIQRTILIIFFFWPLATINIFGCAGFISRGEPSLNIQFHSFSVVFRDFSEISEIAESYEKWLKTVIQSYALHFVAFSKCFTFQRITRYKTLTFIIINDFAGKIRSLDLFRFPFSFIGSMWIYNKKHFTITIT